jgi:hypothetical protein
MRANGAATVLVGINQRRQGNGAFDRGIKLDAQFAQQAKLRTKSRCHDQFIGDDVPPAACRSGAKAEPAAVPAEVAEPEFSLDCNLSGGDPGGEGLAQFAARGKLVVGAAAERFCGIVAAQQPDRLRARGLFGEAGEVDQRSDRGMSRAENRDRLARIARPVVAEHIGHAVGDVACHLCFAGRAQAVGSGRIGREPGSGRIDDGIGLEAVGAASVLIAEFERRGLAAPGLEFVEADAADVGDAARDADMILELRPGRQRLQVALDQFTAGRVERGVRRIPADPGEQTGGGTVDIVFPRRKQLHMAPLPHRVANLRTGLQHHGGHATFQNMGRGGEADRARTDDGDSFYFSHDCYPILLEISKLWCLKSQAALLVSLLVSLQLASETSAQHSATRKSTRPRITS